jgi:uncharacterized membrane protein
MVGIFVVVLHLISVFMLVSGSVGRNLLWMHMRRSTDLASVHKLLEVAENFEKRLVRPGSGLVLLTGLIAAWLRGWPILGGLQGRGPHWVLAAIGLYLTFIPLVTLLFIPKMKVRERALAGALEKGEITPELTAAIHDRALYLGRGYELATIVVFTWLMIAKPF